MLFTLNYLRSILDYDPVTGLFTWKKQIGRRIRVGEVAGSSDKDGYIVIQIDGIKYKAHRLAYLYMTGEWPEDEIDHRDGCPAMNAWNNLRDATRVENIINSDRELGESGFRGVKFDPRTRTWRARIGRGYQREYIGAYATAEEAYEAYLTAANAVHGEFALHKRNPTEDEKSWL
jgi:HNH endonuclease/AP2 domain